MKRALGFLIALCTLFGFVAQAAIAQAPPRSTSESRHELERRLRVTEPVIKFLTVRIDEEQKRLDKIKKLREARRKPAPAPAETGGETAAVTA